MSTYDCPTVYISKFLNIILSPLVQELPSSMKDTPQFLQITNDIEFPANANHKPLLFTIDVNSLYSSIPHDGALKASKHFLNRRSSQTMSNVFFLCHLLKRCLLSYSFNSSIPPFNLSGTSDHSEALQNSYD